MQPNGFLRGGAAALPCLAAALLLLQIAPGACRGPSREASSVSVSGKEAVPKLTQKLAVDPHGSTADPSAALPKVAFLFLARGPLPLAAIWERFLKGSQNRASVYVHSSVPGFRLNDGLNSSSVFWNRQVGHVRVEWGGLGMVKAEKKLLEAALLDSGNQRFVLVSDACIPLRSFDYTYDYLFAGNKSFLTSYNSTWRLGGRLVEQHIPKHMLRKGSQWFAFTRKHALLVVNEFKYYELFKNAKARIPDETYLQTVVPLLDPGNIEPRPITYVQWWGFKQRTKAGTPPPFGDYPPNYNPRKAPPQAVIGHPRAFYNEDVSRGLIQEIQGKMVPAEERISFTEFSNSGPCEVGGNQAPCYLFARKFAGETVEKLLEMSDLLGY